MSCGTSKAYSESNVRRYMLPQGTPMVPSALIARCLKSSMGITVRFSLGRLYPLPNTISVLSFAFPYSNSIAFLGSVSSESTNVIHSPVE